MLSHEIITDPEDGRLLEQVRQAYATLGEIFKDDEGNIPQASLLTGQLICGMATKQLVPLVINQGLYACNESHKTHHIVTLADPTQPPSDDDLIVCMVWGQYNEDYMGILTAGNRLEQPAYIGPRRGIRSIIQEQKYDGQYGVDSIYLQQHTWTTGKYGETIWLLSRPDLLKSGEVPIGEIPYEDFIAMPEGAWAVL